MYTKEKKMILLISDSDLGDIRPPSWDSCAWPLLSVVSPQDSNVEEEYKYRKSLPQYKQVCQN